MVFQHKNGAQKRKVNKDTWERAAKISNTLTAYGYVIKEPVTSSHDDSSPLEESRDGMRPSSLIMQHNFILLTGKCGDISI